MSGAESEGGDPVCWLDRVCPECGAFRENPALPGCARCGTVFGAEEGPVGGTADPTGQPDRTPDDPARSGASGTDAGPRTGDPGH